MNPIPFSKAYIPEISLSNDIADNGAMIESTILQELAGITGQSRILLTHSCTAALEMSALLAEINAGDEVIMPSFTFVSSANAFVLRGAIPIFVDIRPDTLNLDEAKIEEAITAKTKAIVAMHYAGVGAEMTSIREIARRRNLLLIEDAAHGILASYQGKPLGSIGNLGCLSFDVSKNLHCFKGGALLVNDERYFERAQWLLEKGTNRTSFNAGKAASYTWVDLGSNYGMNLLNAHFLLKQLMNHKEIAMQRMSLWTRYYLNLNMVKTSLGFRIPEIPKDCDHNAHIFYLICENQQKRDSLIAFLKGNGITASFHYIPLHSSAAGLRFSRFHGEDTMTTKLSQSLIRLPLFHSLTFAEVDYICEKVIAFFNQ